MQLKALLTKMRGSPEERRERFEAFWNRVWETFPFAHTMFMKIAEPRVLRLMQFGVYASLAYSGAGILLNPPNNFENVAGLTLVYFFGSFLTLGSLVGAFSVLPGIFWLERVGIVLLSSGVGMYVILLVLLNASSVGVGVSVAFILLFTQRWSMINGSQLAPRKA